MFNRKFKTYVHKFNVYTDRKFIGFIYINI